MGVAVWRYVPESPARVLHSGRRLASPPGLRGRPPDRGRPAVARDDLDGGLDPAMPRPWRPRDPRGAGQGDTPAPAMEAGRGMAGSDAALVVMIISMASPGSTTASIPSRSSMA